MSRALVGAGLLLWIGVTLLLSCWRRVSRPGLAERLAPFSPGQPAPSRAAALSAASLREIFVPVAGLVGDRLSAAFGVHERPGIRLRRIHDPSTAAAFRARQVGLSAVALVPGVALAAAGAPVGFDLLALLGVPLLTFLVVEQRLASASERWQESLRHEIPVVGEQLAMLLNAGFSLGAAINRLADRGQGCAARDLAVVANRIRQGVGESVALREWSEVARVDAVDRLVGVLALHSSSSDLGRLVSTEVRQVRRDLHRRTAALLDRRAQQVWIPVTVATLVPGTVLLAVPFLSALRLFANA